MSHAPRLSAALSALSTAETATATAAAAASAVTATGHVWGAGVDVEKWAGEGAVVATVSRPAAAQTNGTAAVVGRPSAAPADGKAVG